MLYSAANDAMSTSYLILDLDSNISIGCLDLVGTQEA